MQAGKMFPKKGNSRGLEASLRAGHFKFFKLEMKVFKNICIQNNNSIKRATVFTSSVRLF
jgi:hypothetical protein